MESVFRELALSEEGAEIVRTRSLVLTGTIAFTLAAATVASAERGERHNGSSAAQFLAGPACAVPEQESSNHMGFVRGRTRAGLIGGAYGEVFFASGASTRAAVNNQKGSANGGGSTGSAPISGGGNPGAGASGAGNGGGGNGNTAATGTSGGGSHGDDDGDKDPSTPPMAGGSNAGGTGGSSTGNGGGNGRGNDPTQFHPTAAAVNPEPSTWLLLGTALCALFLARSRQAQHHG